MNCVELSLLEIQIKLLYEYLGTLRFAPNTTKLVLELDEKIEPDNMKRAWVNVIRDNAILRSTFKWKGLDTPVLNVYPPDDYPVNFDFLSTAVDTCEEVFEDIKKYVPDSDFHTMYVRLYIHKKCFLGFHFIPVLLDGWSLSVMLDELLESYLYFSGKKHRAIKHKTPYEEIIRNHIRGIPADKNQGFLKSYMKKLDSPSMLIQGTKYNNIKRLDVPLYANAQQVKSFCNVKQITPAVLFYCIWALHLYLTLNRNTIAFGITMTDRGTTIPLDTIGQFIRTVPCILTINETNSIYEILQTIKDDIICKLVRPELNLWDYLQFKTFQSHIAFDSLVVIENYPIDFNKAIKITNYCIQEKAAFHIVFGIFLEQGMFALQYDSVQCGDLKAQKIRDHILYILDNILNERWVNIHDIKRLSGSLCCNS